MTVVVMTSTLYETQAQKEQWENLGAVFSLRQDGSLDLRYTGSLMYDVNSKAELGAWLSDHVRDLHALVIADGNQLAIGRFAYLEWELDRGRYAQDLGAEKS